MPLPNPAPDRPLPPTRCAIQVFALLLVLALAACSAPAAPQPTATPFSGTPRPVVVDTDMAPDDWMAILYLLQRQDVSVQAITVAGTGEAHCSPGVKNALGLAALAGQPDIPVACGRETPLQGSHAFPEQWRSGADAVLGLRLPDNPNAAAPQSAAELIASAPEGTTLLTLGPLTNLAEALQAAPGLAGRLAGVYIMGGAGNTYAEWNFYVDPYAAQLVLASDVPVTLVPLDATNHVPATTAFYNRLKRSQHTAEARFVFDVLTQNKAFLASGSYYFWDPLAAAILADESLATFETRALAVVTVEEPESGRVTAAQAGPGVRYATGADAARFEALFSETVNAVWP